MPLRNSLRTFALALLTGAVVFIIGHSADVLLQAEHPQLAMLDDIVFAFLTVAAIMLFDRWRRRRIRDKLWLISEMNHHVRNQLQIIQYSAYATGDREHFNRMQESVSRIDWALREILGKAPANGLEPKPPQSVPAPPQSTARTPRR